MGSVKARLNSAVVVPEKEKPAYLFFLALLVVVAAVVAFWKMGDGIIRLESLPLPMIQEKTGGSFSSLSINDRELRLEIARTEAEHYQGLSDRASLCPECGMLFLFSNSEERRFVMRRMNFPLDIVWLSSAKIVHIDTNLPPEVAEPYMPYGPELPVDAVIELNAGAAQSYGLQVGQHINLPQ